MTRNPFYNAVFAAAYIVGIVYFVTNFVARSDIVEPTMLIPMAMLSLFVLSAAVMGYLFLYEPLMLHFDNKRIEAVSLFLQTTGYFALITVIFFGVLLWMH